MLTTLLQVLHVFVCSILMFVVLLQQGKGGGMGAALGGGGAAQVFGGRGAGNILTRATAIAATTFMLTSVSLAYRSSMGDRALRARTTLDEERRATKKPAHAKEDKSSGPASSGATGGAGSPVESVSPVPPAPTPVRPPPPKEAHHVGYLSPASLSQTVDATLASDARAARTRIAPALALVGLKVAVSAWVIHIGFTHISDDDYARVTIAQAFAHEPRLDPSGTSWLPFPFWLNGTAMALMGRSLAVARTVAVASSVAGALIVHRSLLGLRVRPWVAWIGVALAMCAPWSAWLGVATVPEALSASLIAAGALCLAQREAHLWGALGLLFATLSRYEAWPVALVFAAACFISASRARVRTSRGARLRELAAGTIALLGPVAWLIWNGHAHGNPFHFVARVAAYRLRITTTAGIARTWSLYPEALVRAGPGALAFIALGIPGLFVDRQLRKRWTGPFVAMLALAAFLVEGDLHDGAPTHHPERALVALFWLGSAFGVDGARSIVLRFAWGHPKREAWLVGIITAITVAWGLAWPERLTDYPARSADEDRSSQLALGAELHARNVPHITLTPCAYEHFALVAGFTAPERVTIEPQTSAASAPCPRVEER